VGSYGRVVATAQPTRIGPFGDDLRRCTGVKFSRNGKLLATVSDPVQIWEISPIKKKFDLIVAEAVDLFRGVNSLAFHPLRPVLAVGTIDLRLWNLENGTRLNLLPGAPTRGIRSVAFSPDGKSIALGMLNGRVSILDFPSGHLVHSFNQHSSLVASLCFSHDGNFLASGGNDHRVFLYDLRRGVTVPLDGHKDDVWGLAFALGDETLASACQDGFVRLWSLANHKVALKLSHDGGPVTSVAFSRDGNYMATSGADGTVRLWPAANMDDITAAEKAKEKKR
jgi:WD40 repeat protein